MEEWPRQEALPARALTRCLGTAMAVRPRMAASAAATAAAAGAVRRRAVRPIMGM